MSDVATKVMRTSRRGSTASKALVAGMGVLSLAYASLCLYAYRVRQQSYVDIMEYEMEHDYWSEAKSAALAEAGAPNIANSLLRPEEKDEEQDSGDEKSNVPAEPSFSYRNVVARMFGLEKLKRLKDGYHLVWQSLIHEAKLKTYLHTKTKAAYKAAYDGVLNSLFAEETRYQMDRAFQVMSMVFDDGDEQLSNLERFAGLLVLQHLVRRQVKISESREAQNSARNNGNQASRRDSSSSEEFKIKLASLSVARHFMRFASAAYGWALLNDVFFAEKDRPKWFDRGMQGERQTNLWCLIQHTKIEPEHILQAKWSSTSYNPAHYVCIDHTTRSLVVAIRGTFDFADILTDLQAMPSVFRGGLAHGGMLQSAKLKLEMVLPVLKENLAQPMLENYSVVCVGHSLGAGVAALLSLLLEDELQGVQVKCFAFGCPCILSQDLADGTSHIISTWVHNSDVVPRLSVASARDLGRRAGRAFKETRRNMRRKVAVDGSTAGGPSPAKVVSSAGHSSGAEDSKTDATPPLRPQLSPSTSPAISALKLPPRSPSAPLLSLPPTATQSPRSSPIVVSSTTTTTHEMTESVTTTFSPSNQSDSDLSGSERTGAPVSTSSPSSLRPSRSVSPRSREEKKRPSPALSTRVATRFTGSMKAVMRKMSKSLTLASTIRLHMGLSMNHEAVSDAELSESEQSALSAAGSDFDAEHSGSDTPLEGRSRSNSEASTDGDAIDQKIRDAVSHDFADHNRERATNGRPGGHKLTVEDHPRLFPPSRIFHVSRNSVNQSHSIDIKNPSQFAHIPLTEGQFLDHLPHAYESALRIVQIQHAPRHAQETKMVHTGTLKLKHMAQTMQVQQNFQLLQRMQRADSKNASATMGAAPLRSRREQSHMSTTALFGSTQRSLPSVSFRGSRRSSLSSSSSSSSSAAWAASRGGSSNRSTGSTLIHSIRRSVTVNRKDERQELKDRSAELFEVFQSN